MTRGVGVREMIRVGAEWEARSRDNPKDVLNVKEGKRGGVGETGDGEEDNKDCLGRSGKVVDGAGLGEGIVRRESRDKRTRRGLEEGCPKRRGASGIGLVQKTEEKKLNAEKKNLCKSKRRTQRLKVKFFLLLNGWMRLCASSLLNVGTVILRGRGIKMSGIQICPAVVGE